MRDETETMRSSGQAANKGTARRPSAGAATPRVAADVVIVKGKRQTPLSDAEIHDIAASVRLRSSHSSADVALFYMMLATGAKPLEIARVRIRDVLEPSGAVKRAAVLSADATIGGEARPLFLRSQVLREALADYMRFRISRKHGLGRDERFGGLDPESTLFLDANGLPYSINTSAGQGASRHLCRGMLEACRRIFRLSGIPGLCGTTLRRTLAGRLDRRGAKLRQIGTVFGIKDLKSARELVGEKDVALGDLFDEIVPM